MADYELTYPGGVLPLEAVDGTEAPAGLQHRQAARRPPAE